MCDLCSLTDRGRPGHRDAKEAVFVGVAAGGSNLMGWRDWCKYAGELN